MKLYRLLGDEIRYKHRNKNDIIIENQLFNIGDLFEQIDFKKFKTVFVVKCNIESDDKNNTPYKDGWALINNKIIFLQCHFKRSFKK